MHAIGSKIDTTDNPFSAEHAKCSLAQYRQYSKMGQPGKINMR